MRGFDKIIGLKWSQQEGLITGIFPASRNKTIGYVCNFSLCVPDAYCDFNSVVQKLSGFKTS